MRDTTGDFETDLRSSLTRWNISPGADALGRMATHFESLVEANRSMNLTRITEPAEAAVKHYADSLAPLLWAEREQASIETVLDVGTGAGFPAVPLAIMRPEWTITALDGTGKKIDFVRRSAETLGLTNLQCEHAHSTHWHPGQRFDLVLCRALATLPKAIEQTARFVADGGWLLVFQTAGGVSPASEAVTTPQLPPGLVSCEPFHYELHLGEQRLTRLLAVYRRGTARSR